ncbi:MAG: DUF2089 family protein [Planctomycetota bacterium]|nr:DUF2089 family protein [Planctomycetota bacterium]
MNIRAFLLRKMTFDLSKHPLGRLEGRDLDMILELVLQSGSIKGLAKGYGVSYPTMRQRLDGLIERVRDAVEGRAPDPLREAVARLVARGELSPAGAREVLDAAKEKDA